MTTRLTTVESLYAAYAERIAATVRLDATEYSATPDGLATLLRDTASRLSPVDPNRECLGEAACSLDALSRFEGAGRVTQALLRKVGKNLYEVTGELEAH
jgi:hypothetical protein